MIRTIVRNRKGNEENIGEDFDDIISNYSDVEESLVVNDQNRVTLSSTEFTKTFKFKQVFGQDSTQIDVFSKTAIPLIKHWLQGYHGVYFVYGQTGTGKTHTMGVIDKVNAYSEGIVPNTIKYLFDYMDDNTSKFWKFRIHLSLYQVYMDNVHDLLNPENKSLTIREDKNDVYIEDLTEVHVKTLNQALNILNAGLSFRKMGAQGYNVTSSRSHTLINIDIYQNIVNEDHIQSVSSRLTLVDLAGTERVRKTKASGTRLKEAQSINSSLSALGNVILGLSKGDYITFRQSKLTRILQNSLKGDSKIVLLATVGSREEDTNETLSTLQFANRWKQVQTNAEDKVSIETKFEHSIINDKINEIEIHYQKREEEYLQHIETLERRLTQTSHSPNIITYDQQSTYSEEKSLKQEFDIEEVVKAHPEIEEQRLRFIIKKQEKYIEHQGKLLFEVCDQLNYINSITMGTPNETLDFASKILTNLNNFKSKLDKEDFDTYRFNPNENENSEFLTKVHENLLEKFERLSKVHHSQVQYNANTRMVQSIIEDFVVLANKLKEHDYALSQIEIMKDYQER